MRRNKILCLFVLFLAQSVVAQKSQFRIVENRAKKQADVLINGRLFTSILYADSLRKHVLYPIIASNGVAVTRGYPINPQVGDQVDHPHQIGMWLNYGDVNGADYWNNSTKIDTNKKAYGTIKVEKISNIKTRRNSAEISISATWYNPGSKAVLKEETLYIFKEENRVRSIQRITSLTALSDVLFKDNKEGFFGLRVSRQLEHPSDKPVDVISPEGKKSRQVDKRITTGFYESNTGIKGEEVFGTRAEWLKLSGRIDRKPIALALLDHPKNVNYPGFLMSRGYGLFATNPLGSEVYTNGKEKLNFSLKKGESIIFNYGLLIANELTLEGIGKLHRQFVSKNAF